MADYTKCKEDADFDRHFSECSIEALGCDSFAPDIRKKLIAARDKSIKTGAEILTKIVNAYQTAREQKLKGIQQSCKTGEYQNKCIATVCSINMPHKCDAKYDYEKGLAGQLCEFYKVACTRLK